MSISGHHFLTQFLPPQDFWPYYVATFVSLELGPFCAVNRVLTVQTTLDSRVLVLSQQCPRWQATYNGQNVAEATLVERGLCSSTWTRPPSPSTMVSRKAWSYSLSLRRQELSQWTCSSHVEHALCVIWYTSTQHVAKLNYRGKLIIFNWPPISCPNSGTQ